jgi:hypothetical protein
VWADEQKPTLSGRRGLIAVVSTAGVGTLIGSFCAAFDDLIPRQVGVNFDQALLNRAPNARALYEALRLSIPKGMNKDLNRLSYSMSGHGDIVLPPTPR